MDTFKRRLLTLNTIGEIDTTHNLAPWQGFKVAPAPTLIMLAGTQGQQVRLDYG